MNTYKRPTKRKRAPMCEETYREIKRRLALGDIQHDIAADLGINQGRISEVKNGKRGADPRQRQLL
jgi:transcriptional regulator with XRE-family HTH domain